MRYAAIGELSYAARELQSAGLAPRTPETLAELLDPALRPQVLAEPIPGQSTPVVDIALDKNIFGAIIQEARRGVSAGLSGLRNEYLRLCLDFFFFLALFLYDSAKCTNFPKKWGGQRVYRGKLTVHASEVSSIH